MHAPFVSPVFYPMRMWTPNYFGELDQTVHPEVVLPVRLNRKPVDERTLREIYLPPFHAAVNAGARSVMAAFNEVDGIPMHAHGELIDGVLRDIEQVCDEAVIMKDGAIVHHCNLEEERRSNRSFVELEVTGDDRHLRAPATAGGSGPDEAVAVEQRRPHGLERVD